MKIIIKKNKEFKKGLLSGKNVKLILEIAVSLSEEEKILTQKYYDPTISSNIIYKSLSPEEHNVTVDKSEAKLSNYKVTYYADDGLSHLGTIEKLEKATVGQLTGALDYLKSIDKWEGEKIMDV